MKLVKRILIRIGLVKWTRRYDHDVQQVSTAKLLGVTLCEILRFDVHVV